MNKEYELRRRHEHPQATYSDELKHELHDDKKAHAEAEKTRGEAIRQRIHDQEQGKERRLHQAERHTASQTISMHADRDASFDQTMEHVRKQVPRPTRTFSKFIHHPAIEGASDILAKTVARPNAILAGGISAFILVLATYSYGKYAGFSLQGSETIVAFAIGWLIGIAYDFFKVMITGKRP